MNYTNGLPKGTVVMWYGNTEDIPDGWAICDGENGTPDLRERFVVGVNDAKEEYKFYKQKTAKDKNRGLEKVILSEAQMPSHRHNVRYTESHQAMNSNTKFAGVKGGGNTTIYDRDATGEKFRIKDHISESSIGNNQSHENRPPYFALYFIMRII